MPFRRTTLAFIVIIMMVASLFSLATWWARFQVSGELTYAFLLWNLILAWMPLGFSLLALLFPHNKLALLSFGGLWLLFFPNAPYIMTDLIHLRPLAGVPIWYDAIMLFGFALTGLLLGHFSLYLMHELVTRQWGPWIGWLFVLVSVALSGLGVYVGRFLRWNSWDVFHTPLSLLNDLFFNLLHPALLFRMVVVSSLLSSVFMLVYLLFFALPRLSMNNYQLVMNKEQSIH